MSAMDEGHMFFRYRKTYSLLISEDIIGQEFESLKDANVFYTTYSKVVRFGFGVRKHNLKRGSDREIKKRIWVCV